MDEKTCTAHIAQAVDAGRRRDYRTAVSLLEAVVSDTDLYPQAFLYLGRSYHALGRYAEALQMLTYYLHLAPESSAGLLLCGKNLPLARKQPESSAVPERSRKEASGFFHREKPSRNGLSPDEKARYCGEVF
jgi:tetratricopeptide (TPR) repeat protein